MNEVTIGIPSYNEEGNITNLLKSIFSSNIDKILIKEVIISDDSTDSTPQLIQNFKERNPSLNVKLHHHDIRRGTAAAWNEIFKEAMEKIIILFDADVIVERDCIAELVGSLAKKERVGLCATNQSPIETTGITGKACSFIMEWLRSLRKRELSKYTVMGRALCICSDLAKSIQIPQEIIAVDLYLQCLVLKSRFDVIYNDRALVYFKPPTNLSEFSSQVIRAQNGHKQVKTLQNELNLHASLRSLLGSVLSSICTKPLEAAAAATSLMLVPYFSRKIGGTDNAKWNTSKTTKSIDYDEFISRQDIENNT
ncbi:MAG: glycosyltransferase [Nitrososphaeraceae archaeon]